MTPGTLLVRIDDEQVVIEVIGAGTHVIPVGPTSLVEGPLEHADPIPPANLTNALGLIHDHLDDIIIESPMVRATTAVVITGRHAEALSRVELGASSCPDRHELARADVDEVFRTLALETLAERSHNPGLPGDQVETIIGTCCIVLALMRKLGLEGVVVEVRGNS